MKILEAYLYEIIDAVIPQDGRLSIIEYGGGDYMVAFSTVYLGSLSFREKPGGYIYTHFDDYIIEQKSVILTEWRCIRYWVLTL